MKKIKRKVLASIILCSYYSISHSASIYLETSTTNVLVGDQFTLNLMMDFTNDPTLGGGLDIQYNEMVADFISFDFDTEFLTLSDPAFTCPGSMAACTAIDQPNLVENIVFGNFGGIDGVHTVGTLTFELMSLGISTIDPLATSSTGGPFVSATTFEPMNVDFSGLLIDNGNILTTQPPSSIPLPASIWLFCSGLGLLVYKKRKTA